MSYQTFMYLARAIILVFLAAVFGWLITAMAQDIAERFNGTAALPAAPYSEPAFKPQHPRMPDPPTTFRWREQKEWI